MSTIARSLYAALSRALLPPTCCLCGAPGQAPDLDLCEVCLTLLPSARGVDAFPLSAPTLVRVRVPFHYAWPIDRLVRAVKFRGERVYARVLGTLLAHHVQALQQPLPHLLVPVPLHRLRYRERGFNQAYELARFAAARLGIAIDSRCLVRKVRTSEQSGLSLTQRHRNVRGAFAAVHSLAGQRVALLDDVLTTGSTALAAATALMAAGAKEVEVWAIARVALDQVPHERPRAASAPPTA